MKINITGGSGFVGSNLIKIIRSKYDTANINLREEKKTTISNETNIVIHLAGKAHDVKNVSNPEEYYKINFELTKNLFESFLNSEADVFIFMSSIKAVTDKNNEILNEEEFPKPSTHYGKSKLLAENYILSKELPKNKKVYILRPSLIYGPGNKGNLNLLYKLVTKKIPWPLGAFENKKTFCYIKNLIFIIEKLIENNQNIESGIYNVADDQNISTNDLIKIIANSNSIKIRIFYIPKSIIYFFTKIGDFFKLPINSEKLEKLTGDSIVSNLKIKKALGITKLPYTCIEGLNNTFKDNK